MLKLSCSTEVEKTKVNLQNRCTGLLSPNTPARQSQKTAILIVYIVKQTALTTPSLWFESLHTNDQIAVFVQFCLADPSKLVPLFITPATCSSATFWRFLLCSKWYRQSMMSEIEPQKDDKSSFIIVTDYNYILAVLQSLLAQRSHPTAESGVHSTAVHHNKHLQREQSM